MRLLVHGDDFVVEMPTHEEKWFESVLMSKCDGKCTGKFHSDGNTAIEASFLNRVIGWDPPSRRAELEADTRHVAMVRRKSSAGVLRNSDFFGLQICLNAPCGISSEHKPGQRKANYPGWRSMQAHWDLNKH